MLVSQGAEGVGAEVQERVHVVAREAVVRGLAHGVEGVVVRLVVGSVALALRSGFLGARAEGLLHLGVAHEGFLRLLLLLEGVGPLLVGFARRLG